MAAQTTGALTGVEVVVVVVLDTSVAAVVRVAGLVVVSNVVRYARAVDAAYPAVLTKYEEQRRLALSSGSSQSVSRRAGDEGR